MIVIDAQHGIEVGTVQAWEFSSHDQNSVIFVVNKLDHVESDFDSVVENAKSRFAHEVAIAAISTRMKARFNAIVDVMKMKLLRFSCRWKKYTEEDIPESVKAKADELHRQLVEIVAESDDTLMEEFFANDGQLDESHFSGGIHESLAHRKLFPILLCIR